MRVFDNDPYWDRVGVCQEQRPIPLRELFPTLNGHRMRTCPNCGNRMGRYSEGYRCLNIGRGCHRTVYAA